MTRSLAEIVADLKNAYTPVSTMMNEVEFRDGVDDARAADGRVRKLFTELERAIGIPPLPRHGGVTARGSFTAPDNLFIEPIHSLENRYSHGRGPLDYTQSDRIDIVPRTPDGHINNCARVYGSGVTGPDNACQMCNGLCPDEPNLPRGEKERREQVMLAGWARSPCVSCRGTGIAETLVPGQDPVRRACSGCAGTGRR